ncbi:coiled-coil domain-containing protein 174-like [Pollicipes pollicipes]|uniref:coiled-coil domain-containing protein 174-like n=1 Tax=Pollicipes pollicipes TaxID=41117 RepID=UPI0018857FDC|nr:coiled-coil domain-containing protein 174-like [Pollicipes pollicipes]
MDRDKKIDVGSSSLVDLKAELHRKQQESKTLRSRPERRQRPEGKSKVWAKVNAGVEQRDLRDKEQTAEEARELDRSRMALEAKASLYEKLRTGTAALEDDATNERFLVNFQRKVIDDVTERRQHRAAEEKETTDPESVTPDDEWVEFTDSLGRSRTVMRRDLAEYRRRDLGRDPDGDPAQTPELVSEDARREQLRQQWQQQELENASKTDIHYQDVLFNAA